MNYKVYFLIIILSVFLILLIQPFHKDKTIILKGTLTDYYTHEPLSACKMQIIQREFIGYHSRYRTIDTFKTDSKGTFDFSFTAKAKLKCSYQLETLSDEYHNTEYGIDKKQSPNNFNIRIKPYKILILNLKNPHGSCILFRNPDIDFEYDTFYSDTSIIFNKSVPDDSFELNLTFFECNSVKSLEFKENIWINNVDTSFITRSIDLK